MICTTPRQSTAIKLDTPILQGPKKIGLEVEAGTDSLAGVTQRRNEHVTTQNSNLATPITRCPVRLEKPVSMGLA